jgi:hypothetical protein
MVPFDQGEVAMMLEWVFGGEQGKGVGSDI